MSHLSILPTVFTRLDLLETALGLEGFDVIRHGVLPDFGRAPRSVDLLALRDGSRPMGWCIDDQGRKIACGKSVGEASCRCY